jgi:hypothetical protein
VCETVRHDDDDDDDDDDENDNERVRDIIERVE